VAEERGIGMEERLNGRLGGVWDLEGEEKEARGPGKGPWRPEGRPGGTGDVGHGGREKRWGPMRGGP